MTWLIPNWFSILSRLIAGYFMWALHLQVGFPPTMPLTPTGATYLGVFIFFLVLPFAQRLKLGKLIEFERVREEIKEVRTEARELVSTVSATVNAVSNTIKQSVVVNVAEERQQAKKELSEDPAQSSEPSRQELDMLEYFGTSNPDLHYALARMRMDLEWHLRKILGKRLTTEEPSRMSNKFLSVRALFQRLASVVPRYKNMQGSFDYLIKVCNAAIHGQQIPEDIADEAMGIGLRILRELKKEPEV